MSASHDSARTSLQWADCPVEVAVVDHSGVRFGWDRERGTDPLPAQLPVLFDHLCTGVVVGHNLQFDFRFITYESDRLGYEGPAVRFIDTLGLARALLDSRDDYRLEALLRSFDVVPDGQPSLTHRPHACSSGNS